MTDDTTGQEKIDQPHAFFKSPQQVVTEPTLSKDPKAGALDAPEQDARRLAAASDEGKASGERNKLQDVLDTKGSPALSSRDFAYEAVPKDLRSRALVEQALAVVNAAP